MLRSIGSPQRNCLLSDQTKQIRLAARQSAYLHTKTDWIVWTATLSSDKETFQKFIAPLHDFITETPDRVPMTDWYETLDAKQVGFQARSVVGGYFIKLLE